MLSLTKIYKFVFLKKMVGKEEGLSAKEAERLLSKYGKNEIENIKKISYFKIFLGQIKGNFIIYLLLAAVIISFAVGETVTAWVIVAVILFVVLAGFIQEFKAEKAVNSLKSMLTPMTIAVRDGIEVRIPSSELVPGDLISLKSGEKIPADCILVKQIDLSVDESILTGESKEIKKAETKNEKSINDKNKIFMGTYIVKGKCIAKVSKTGMDTQFGKIAEMISKAEKELPLQKKVNRIAKITTGIAIVIAILTGLIVLFQSPISKESIVGALILIIAISVSAFPEGFPVVLITTLSVGAYRMAKKNAIVNRMSIIETLGETTVICSDKTGTITKGEMTAKKIIIGEKEYNISGVGYVGKGDFELYGKKIEIKSEKDLGLLIRDCVICNDSKIFKTEKDAIFEPLGDPTEAALLILGAKAGILKENLREKIVSEIPFSSERKLMTVVTQHGGETRAYSKGAIEIILKKCKYIKKENGTFRLLERDKKAILEKNRKLTSNSYRVLGVSFKDKEIKNPEEDMTFLGLVALEDPPREEIKRALETCKRAGIKVKMITGDNKETAVAIAKQIGLKVNKVFNGEEIDSMTDKELEEEIQEITVFSRVRPEHKIRIVNILKGLGEIVTMTGDGVNDAPALKEAHIGVAMGINGTDVSKSVADITLKDDNFATIVDAVKEGRTIFHNIRKFISYQLSCNYSEMAILFLGVLLVPFFGWPVPVLLALQILFMNLVTDNLPAITLGFNSSSEDIMEEKVSKNRNLLNGNLFKLIAFSGILMSFLTLLVFYMVSNVMGESAVYARTAALATLIILEIANAFNFRSFRKGTLTRSPFANKALVWASLVSIVATIIIIYTPLGAWFSTAPIGILDWAVTIGAALVLLLIFDILKKINKRKKFWHEDAKWA